MKARSAITKADSTQPVIGMARQGCRQTSKIVFVDQHQHNFYA